MKISIKKLTKSLLVVVWAALFVFATPGSPAGTTKVVHAATAPDLGLAEGYSVFGNAGITETPAQNSGLWGDVGDNGLGHADLIASQVEGTLFDVAQPTVVGAISIAYGELAAQAQTGAIDLATSPTVGPGVYDIAATSFESTLTLDGDGVYIFRSTSSIAQTAGGTMNLINGATACNVFWQIPAAMTFGAVGDIAGTIITNTELISFVSGVNLQGRAFAATQVTMDNNQITEPTCAGETATLNVIKTVVNNDGGTATASDFTIGVTGTNVSPSSFAGSEDGVEVTLDAGEYSVAETAGPSGYLSSGSGDCSGTIAAGETKTCTITNNDIAPQLTVNKIVINDDGGTNIISDFPLFLDDVSVESGVATTTTIGEHTVSETTDPDYTAVIGGDCAADGTITLALGDIETCTITNDDIAPSGGGGGSSSPTIPPIINLVKAPSPLALPDGPGPVTYSYTLSNIGTVSVTDITLVGDTCSPIVVVSGDTNSNNILEVEETWVYTCSTTLSETHTNIVTATGWANGISASDTANSTVIVGIPVDPPLINVTKVPNPLALSAGGGMVTYTNKVTNPGTIPLSNVQLSDDKCSPVTYVFGDTNNDSKLDPTETWTYTCQTNLTNTTVNTAAASGEANNLTARDTAIATVIVSAVSAVGLPEAGIGPDERNILWNIVIPSGILVVLISLLYVVRRKQTV